MEFVENKGQWDSRVEFRGDFTTGSFFIENKGFTVLMQNAADLQKLADRIHGHSPIEHDPGTNPPVPNNDPVILHSHAYKVRFLGAAANVMSIPDKKLPTYNNYFIGDEHDKWASNCSIFQAITYKNIYPGIDVRYYSNSGKLKYDIIVHPGGNIGNIVMRYDGADKLSVINKELVIGTSVGEVRELYPYSYQLSNGVRKIIDCKFVVKGNTVRFNAGNYDANETLVIDPTLVFSTLTGSSADNWGYTATPGPNGTFFAAGISFGSGFPVSPGAFQGGFGGGVNEDGNTLSPYDISIIKYSANGSSRLYATYLGGSANEQPHSMICDAQGNLIVAGKSFSANFPKTIPQIGPGGGYDMIVTKFNASGTAILGSVKMGGSNDDGVNIKSKYSTIAPDGAVDTRRNYGDDSRSEVILDAAGNIYFASCSQSSNYPIINSTIQSTFGGGLQDGVIVKFNPNLSAVLFSTFFGGSGNDACFSLGTSKTTGELYVVGATTSNNIPGDKTGTINATYQGGITDGFILRMQNDGSAIIKSTYLGTSGNDMVYGIQYDKFGYPYVMGTTTGDWPVISAAYSNPGSKQFISKLQSDLSGYVYSTIFGTNASVPNISPVAFLVDRCENVYVSGWGGRANTIKQYPSAGTTGLPVTGSLLSGFNGDGSDFYFFVLEKNATSQFYGALFGELAPTSFGDHCDGGTSRYDENGVIYQAMCAACGGSQNFPTTPGVWSVSNGSGNCNLGAVKIEMNFAGVGAGIQASINAVINDTVGCTPLTVDFTDTLQKGKKFYWDFGDGSPVLITTSFNTSHTYIANGRYRVMLIAEDSSTCNIRDTGYVTIKAGNNRAFLNFTAVKDTPCTSLKYIFTNTSSASFSGFGPRSFYWDYGDGTPRDTAGLSPARNHIYPSPGTYKVKLFVKDTTFCNSPDSIEKTIRINQTVIAKFTTPSKGCVPYAANFSNTSLGGTDFLWNFGDGSPLSTLPDPIHLYTSIGTYNVKMYAFDSTTCNKVDSAFFTITVHPIPVALFTFSPNPPDANRFVAFTNQSAGATNYVWDFDDGETSTEINPRHIFNATQLFNTCLAAINNVSGCADTFCLNIPARVNTLLDVPNAFTPGKFGTNAVIKVAGFGIGKMDWKIYNRWGQLVFKTTNRKEGWDGMYKGELQPMDVYAYTLDVTFTDGKTERKSGDITLLR
jgi:gliding motility-associated-like protein